MSALVDIFQLNSGLFSRKSLSFILIKIIIIIIDNDTKKSIGKLQLNNMTI